MNPTPENPEPSSTEKRKPDSPATHGSTPAYGFGVLMLADLKIRRFAFKDEMKAAIAKFENDNVPFVPLIYHLGANQWTIPEVHRW